MASSCRGSFSRGFSCGEEKILVDTGTFGRVDRPDLSFWPSGIYVDLREYYRSLDRLRDLGGVVLPGHDMLVLKNTVYP
jgi:hypothetical protein